MIRTLRDAKKMLNWLNPRFIYEKISDQNKKENITETGERESHNVRTFQEKRQTKGRRS